MATSTCNQHTNNLCRQAATRGTGAQHLHMASNSPRIDAPPPSTVLGKRHNQQPTIDSTPLKDRVGTHFRVRVASPLFDGKSRVARHRLVYDALQNFIDQGLHALAIEIIDSP